MNAPRFDFVCDLPFCDALDFIPAKCDHCLKIFCGGHIKYDQHNCPKPDNRNKQVVICPLCNLQVPPGALSYDLELTAIEHIDQNCQADLAVARRQWVVNLMRSCAW